MKYQLFRWTLLCLSVWWIGAATAQNRVVEASARKMPVWVDKAETEYIVVSSVAPAIEQAQEKCLAQVKTRILESVAQYVDFRTESTVEQSAAEGDRMTEFSDSFFSRLETRAATLPFVKGISIAKVEEAYWEKLQDKKTKEVTYRYAIKYPFPRIEQKKLVAEFERQDREKVGRLEALQEELDQVASTDRIARALSELDELRTYFFDPVRLAAVDRLIAGYTALYADIEPQTVEEGPGYASFVFLLHGREIEVPGVPQIKADCATQVTVNRKDDRYTVRYRYDMCPEDEQSRIDLTYRAGGRPLRHTIYFTARDTTVSIVPVGELLVEESGPDSARRAAFTLDIRVGNARTVEIREVVFNLSNARKPVVIDRIDRTLTGEGTHRLRVESDRAIEWTPALRMNVVRGQVVGTYDSGRLFRSDFLLPFRH